MGISTSNRLQMTLVTKMGTFSHHREETTFLTASGTARANWTEISAGIVEYLFLLKKVSTFLWILFYPRENRKVVGLVYSFQFLGYGKGISNLNTLMS